MVMGSKQQATKHPTPKPVCGRPGPRRSGPESGRIVCWLLRQRARPIAGLLTFVVVCLSSRPLARVMRDFSFLLYLSPFVMR